jgi:hypothetical protein
VSDESFDLASSAATLVVIAVALAVVIYLLPMAVDVAWQVAPSILVLALIWAGLMTILNKFLQ